MYGRLATILGYTFEQIEESPYPFIKELFEYWNEEPPVEDFVRGYFQYKPAGRKGSIEGEFAEQVASSSELTQADRAFLGEVGGDVKTFDNLPLHVQAFLNKKQEAKQAKRRLPDPKNP